MTNRRAVLLNSLALFFLIYGTFAMDYAVYRGQPSWIFWICYVGGVILGFGVFFRHSPLIASQLYILTVPVLIWLIDFLSRLVSNQHLFGTTRYFFEELLWPARLISLGHFVVVPLGYFAFWLIGGKVRGAWIFSLVQISLLYVIGRLWSDASQNVNCVFQSCFPYVPDGEWYPVFWFMIISGMIGITWLIVRLAVYLSQKMRYN